MTRTVGAAIGILLIVMFFAVIASERTRAAPDAPDVADPTPRIRRSGRRRSLRRPQPLHVPPLLQSHPRQSVASASRRKTTGYAQVCYRSTCPSHRSTSERKSVPRGSLSCGWRLALRERLADGILRVRHLEQVDEQVDEELAIRDRGSHARRRAAGHLDPEVLAGRFGQELEEQPIGFVPGVAPAGGQDARLFIVGVAIHLQARWQRDHPRIPLGFGALVLFGGTPLQVEQRAGSQGDGIEVAMIVRAAPARSPRRAPAARAARAPATTPRAS